MNKGLWGRCDDSIIPCSRRYEGFWGRCDPNDLADHWVWLCFEQFLASLCGVLASLAAMLEAPAATPQTVLIVVAFGDFRENFCIVIGWLISAFYRIFSSVRGKLCGGVQQDGKPSLKGKIPLPSRPRATGSCLRGKAYRLVARPSVIFSLVTFALPSPTWLQLRLVFLPTWCVVP